MAKGEKPDVKPPAPYERKDNALVVVSHAEVERVLREYVRSLNLRGYPMDEAGVIVEIQDTGWQDSQSYMGSLIVRFEVQ